MVKPMRHTNQAVYISSQSGGGIYLPDASLFHIMRLSAGADVAGFLFGLTYKVCGVLGGKGETEAPVSSRPLAHSITSVLSWPLVPHLSLSLSIPLSLSLPASVPLQEVNAAHMNSRLTASSLTSCTTRQRVLF